MTVDFASQSLPLAGAAVGIGIWVYFAWCWLGAGQARRSSMVGWFGLVTGGAFGGGLAVSLASGTTGLSSMGAALGGGAALMVVARPWQSADLTRLDVLVPGAVAGVSVARLGCLLEGCDFGRVAEFGPSVVYGPTSRAWEVHVLEYGLSHGSPISLEVIPFAGYLAVWGLGCAAVGEWWRRRARTAGLGAVISVVAFGIGGGALEWLREPATVPQFYDGWPVYPMLYWSAAALIFGWWALRRRGDGEVH